MDLYNQWLHHAQQPSQQDSGSATSSDTARGADDDWKDTRQTLDHANDTQSPMDLTDFGSITESAPGLATNGSDSASASPAPFPTYSNESSIFMPSYSGLSYTPSSWLNPPSSVPLSSYSTLNGATSSSNTGNGQQQQPAQMMIDPALLGDSTYYPNFSSQPSPPSPPSRNAPPYPYLGSQFYSSASPPSSSVTDSVTPQSITPQSLHAPSPPPPPPPQTQSINPASFYATTSPSLQAAQTAAATTGQTITTPTTDGPSEEKKRKFRSSVQPLLSSTAFTGAQAVHTLVDKILDFGIASVEPSMRLEILTKIRDYSGKPYLRAWAENENAMKVTKKWLSAGSAAPKDDPLKETVMPILHIIQRLPLTLDALAEHKLGKMILKLTTDSVPAIKDMASDIEHQWRQLMSSAAAAGKNPSEDRVTKKRKIGDPPLSSKVSSIKPPSATTAPAARKVPGAKAGVAGAGATAVKKEGGVGGGNAATGGTTKTVVTAVSANTSKSDTSFFSSKPNKKLPSFKKAPPPPPPTQVKKEEPPQPQINAFAVALEGLKRRDSPAVNPSPPPVPPPPIASATSNGSASSTPPADGAPGAPGTTITGVNKLMKNGKPRKSVTWAPPERLEMIKLIERAVYEDDPAEGEHSMHSLRELDRGEGAALHAHLFEELLDWYEPIPFELPQEVEAFEYGSLSTEREAQEQREQTALAAVYMSSAHIPDSPSEPNVYPVQDDQEVKIMICGPELDAIFFGANDTEMSAHPPPPLTHHLHHPHHPPPHDVGPSSVVGVGLMDTTLGGGQQQQQPNSTNSFAGVDQAKLADIAKMLSSVSPNLFSSMSQNNNTVLSPHQPQPSALPPTSANTLQQAPTSMPQAPTSAWGGESEWGNEWSSVPSYPGNAGMYHHPDSALGNPAVSNYPHAAPTGYDHHQNGGYGSSASSLSSSSSTTMYNGKGRGGNYTTPYKKVPCRFFMQGRCSKGDHCTYSHEMT